MRRTVRWHALAERDVLHMDWKVAARICAAVGAFAERGEGSPENTAQPGLVRLRVRGAAALFRVDADYVWVLRLYATRQADMRR